MHLRDAGASRNRVVTVIMPMTDIRGGAERALLSFLQGAAARNSVKTVIFLETPGPLSEQVEELGYRVHCLPVRRLRDAPSVLRAAIRVLQLIRQDRCEIVLTWMTRAAPIGHIAAKLAGVSHLIYQHGVTTRSRFERLVFGVRPDGVLVCSNYCAESLAELYPKLPRKVVWPGLSQEQLDQARVGRAAARARLGIDERSRVVGTVARLQAWKGAHHVLAAAAHIAGAPDVQFLIVGGAPPGAEEYQQELMQMAASGPNVRAQLVGASSCGSLWIAAFDVFVHSADGEPFGLVIAEAMAARTAVVASATGGPRELLAEGEFGTLVDPGDSGELAAAISRALEPSAARTELLDRAAERVDALEPDAFAQRVLRACSQLAGRPAEMAR